MDRSRRRSQVDHRVKAFQVSDGQNREGLLRISENCLRFLPEITAGIKIGVESRETFVASGSQERGPPRRRYNPYDR